jgi:gamma-glutamylcyclotransferase (GGCT)/AIG2-like uncharacterized protein YtfP
MSKGLFVYGTLRQGRFPAEIAAAVGRLRLVGRGVAWGRLYDLGEYPGASFGMPAAETKEPDTETAVAAGCTSIEGEVYEVPDARTWRELDAYEGFEPNNPAASLFVRREIEVKMSSGERVVCWAYEYNRRVEPADLHLRVHALEPATRAATTSSQYSARCGAEQHQNRPTPCTNRPGSFAQRCRP